MDATQKITKNLGGNRLGSGAKNNITLHKYNRSTHDLSRAWRSSMNVGTLVPFLVEPALPGDTWTINLEALVRTLPAVRPLYGSYKLQLDIFEAPVRLYNGLLHNNMTKIGLHMDQVKLPKVELSVEWQNPNNISEPINQMQIASDSLINYLGISGIGDCDSTGGATLIRKFNAVPIIAYYDIYKNYYANKQEEEGKIIKPELTEEEGYIYQLEKEIWLSQNTNSGIVAQSYMAPNPNTAPPIAIAGSNYSGNAASTMYLLPEGWAYTYRLCVNNVIEIDGNNIQAVLRDGGGNYIAVNINTLFPNWEYLGGNTIELYQFDTTYNGYEIIGWGYNNQLKNTGKLAIETFDLQNIDDMRVEILRNTGIGVEYLINTINKEPYNTVSGNDNHGQPIQKYHQAGLALKTHQSDLLNNWMKTEWIDGVGGINEITAIDTSSGSFQIDALNLANKVYNMLNRIAVSGGSSYDYYEAVYSVEVSRRAETPIYCGGMSTEIVFEEVVSQTAAENQPLGTLAGKGTTTNKRGGHVEIHVKDEPSFIIGIVSITPRIDYSQGNKWFMTELDNVADLHKPELDGIGFEDLLEERAAWWGTYWDTNDQEWKKLAMGKVPAWINYMTAKNETHGTFAEELNTMDMTLNRRYEYNYDQNQKLQGIKDTTTYIDPSKYNYAFANTALDAQNFWVQIGMQIEARRVMSAKVIPYL